MDPNQTPDPMQAHWELDEAAIEAWIDQVMAILPDERWEEAKS